MTKDDVIMLTHHVFLFPFLAPLFPSPISGLPSMEEGEEHFDESYLTLSLHSGRVPSLLQGPPSLPPPQPQAAVRREEEREEETR